MWTFQSCAGCHSPLAFAPTEHGLQGAPGPIRRFACPGPDCNVQHDRAGKLAYVAVPYAGADGTHLFVGARGEIFPDPGRREGRRGQEVGVEDGHRSGGGDIGQGAATSFMDARDERAAAASVRRWASWTDIGQEAGVEDIDQEAGVEDTTATDRTAADIGQEAESDASDAPTLNRHDIIQRAIEQGNDTPPDSHLPDELEAWNETYI